MERTALNRLGIAALTVVPMTVLLSIGLLPTASLAAAGVNCEELAGLKLKDTYIDTADIVPAGDFTPPGADNPIGDVPEFCRIAASIHPSADSSINFEVWMPTEGWNQKFFSAGEGGWAGALNYSEVADALRRGYAGGSTDTGHVGGNADFAPGHPEKVIDFGWRAKHLQAVKSKQIIHAFYGQEAKHSYFSGCSNGGKQAMMEIQRFPDDYDGVIVGAPAHNWTNLFASFVFNEQAAWSDPASELSAGHFAALQEATLKSCDGLDGVVDGVVDDPRNCSFDPKEIMCQAGVESDSCLTEAQVSAVTKIMQGPGSAADNFPGFYTSAANDPTTWGGWIVGPEAGASIQAFFGNSFFGRVIKELPAPEEWDFKSFDIAAEMPATNAKIAKTFNAVAPDLSAFLALNPDGKIIFWHGWEDAAIPAESTINYFEEVQAENADAENFTRLFLAPGMAHCRAGPGPNAFGQGLSPLPPLSHAPEHDILSALANWVENGVAPEKIIAVKYREDDPSKGIERTRPLCSYPLVARYDGEDGTDEAENFTCVPAT
jgi:feruloyl esterase